MNELPDYVLINTDDFSIRTMPKIQKTEFDDGYVKNVKKTSKLNMIYELSIILINLDDLTKFMLFFKNDLKHGAARFIWQNPITKNKQIVRINNALDFKLIKNNLNLNAFEGWYVAKIELEAFE